MTAKSSPDTMIAQVREAIAKHPPMPALVRDLITQMQDPNLDLSVLSETVRCDPGLTMNILRIVNSVAFSGCNRIESIQQALVRLGARRLTRIAISQVVATHLAGRLEGYDLEPRMLLRHAIGVAVNAEALARRLGLADDMIFTGGLLHDMGKVVLDPFILTVRPAIDAALRGTGKAFDALERELLGVTHAQAGAWLMRQWGLPEALCAMVEHHHDPGAAGVAGQSALVVHLADTLVYGEGLGDGVDGLRYHVDGGVAARALGLRTADLERVASLCLQSMNEWNKLLI